MSQTVTPHRLEGMVHRYLVVIVLLATSVGVASCADLLSHLPPPVTKTPFVLSELPEGAVELPFETLGKDYSGALLSIRQPTLVIVSSQEENQVWEDFFFPGVLDRLPTFPWEMDIDSYFILGVFQGYRGCIGPTVEIKQIVRQDDMVQVYVYFTEILPQEPCRTQATSPYHLVKVRKEGEWNSEFKFILYDNDQPVAEVRHFIP